MLENTIKTSQRSISKLVTSLRSYVRRAAREEMAVPVLLWPNSLLCLALLLAKRVIRIIMFISILLDNTNVLLSAISKGTWRTKQIIVTEAQDLWKRASEKEKQAFKALLPGEKPFKSENSEEPSTSSTVVCRKAGDGWFQSDRSTEGETSSSHCRQMLFL